MKEHPILFSTPMVQAILDGRKSKTRRIIQIPDLIEKPDRFRYKGNSTEFDIPRKAIPYDDRLYHLWELVNSNACSWVEHSHKPGDILYVKEMYYAYGMWLKNGKSKKEVQKWKFFDTTQTGFDYRYCDNPPESIMPNTKRETYGWFKGSSLFMPHKASRIKLEITNIRVERVQDISKKDAIAEGIEILDGDSNYKNYLHGNGRDYGYVKEAKISYMTLWESINGKYSWNRNPWVWVIEFKKL